MGTKVLKNIESFKKYRILIIIILNRRHIDEIESQLLEFKIDKKKF